MCHSYPRSETHSQYFAAFADLVDLIKSLVYKTKSTALQSDYFHNIHTLKDLARIVYPISTSIVNYRIRNKNGPATSHTLSWRCDIFSR